MGNKKVLLIKITDDLFIHVNDIKRAERMGTYVVITLMNGNTEMYWDEDELIIKQIRRVAGAEDNQ